MTSLPCLQKFLLYEPFLALCPCLKEESHDGHDSWTPKPARSYIRPWQCILILKAILKKFLLPYLKKKINAVFSGRFKIIIVINILRRISFSNFDISFHLPLP